MLRQVSSRNHRSKGFKLKNALQICLLVVVTIWLLFQVKHSYDKKNEFEDHRNAHSSSIKHDADDRRGGGGGGGGDRHELFKLGRKDLPGGDVRIEDEASEDELEHELLKRGGGESEAIDEQDQGKDGGGGDEEDEPGALEDAENAEEGGKEGEGVPEERGDHSREARERSFNGDNVASAVDHEDRSSENAESKVVGGGGGGENLMPVESASDGGGGGGGLKDREVTPSNEVSSSSSNSTAADERNGDPKPRVDPTTNSNVDGNQTDRATESPTNATTASNNNNQIELSTTNLTVPERNETTNSGSGSGSDSNSDSAHDRISGDGEFNTSSTASPATTGEEEGEGRVEFQDTTPDMAEEETREAAPRAKIEERAKTGEEAVVLE